MPTPSCQADLYLFSQSNMDAPSTGWRSARVILLQLLALFLTSSGLARILNTPHSPASPVCAECCPAPDDPGRSSGCRVGVIAQSKGGRVDTVSVGLPIQLHATLRSADNHNPVYT